jgi:ankyrin repeat protein
MNRIDGELIKAAEDNNVPEVRRLLSVGADVNVRGLFGCTSFHWACMKGRLQVFQAFREHGADIEATNNFGLTPLHMACYNGHLPVVKALLAAGADILAADDQGRLPFHHALDTGRSEVAKCLLQHFYATTRRLPIHDLLEDLTSIGDPDISDVPPLHDALHHEVLGTKVLGTDDIVEILECLVDQNPAWISSHDQDGTLPLHVACRRGAPFAIVQSLVNNHKASVKSLTPQGDLPLFLACEMPETSLDTIFILVKLYPDLVYR